MPRESPDHYFLQRSAARRSRRSFPDLPRGWPAPATDSTAALSEKFRCSRCKTPRLSVGVPSANTRNTKSHGIATERCSELARYTRRNSLSACGGQLQATRTAEARAVKSTCSVPCQSASNSAHSAPAPCSSVPLEIRGAPSASCTAPCVIRPRVAARAIANDRIRRAPDA